MRLHHFIIGILMASVFAVFLFSTSQKFMSDVHINESAYMENNTNDVFNKLDQLNLTTESITNAADLAPGGSDSRTGETTSETTMQISALGLISTIGVLLFSVPKVLIFQIATFFGISEVLASVAFIIIILMVAIITASSILRNRL